MTTELDISSLTGLIQYIGIKARIGSEQEQETVAGVLTGVIGSLASMDVTLDDAVTLQALALQLTREIYICADNPVKVKNMSENLILIQMAAGRVLEFFGEAKMTDRMFFEDKTAKTVQ